jgi:hypothetical protein
VSPRDQAWPGPRPQSRAPRLRLQEEGRPCWPCPTWRPCSRVSRSLYSRIDPRRRKRRERGTHNDAEPVARTNTFYTGSTCIFAIKPYCLLAELALDGEHLYTFQARLPPALPPSFKGVSTKYSYFLTVCVKLRSEESARIVHIPFFVAGTPGSLGDAARRGPPLPSFFGSDGNRSQISTPVAPRRIVSAFNAPNSVDGRVLQPTSPPVPSSNSKLFQGDEEEELALLGEENDTFSASPSSKNGKSRPESTHPTADDFEDDEVEVLFEVNRFPQKFGDKWDAEERSSSKLVDDRMLFTTNDGEDEDEELLEEYHMAVSRPAPSPIFGSSPSPRTSNLAAPMDAQMVRAFNAQNAKSRVAKCFVQPYIVHPGDAVNVRLEFTPGSMDKCTRVQAFIQVEEKPIGPPPPSAAFEPILRKRQGGGPWTRTVAKKAVDVSICSSCAFSLSSFGAPPDFSTDFIIVRSYLKLEFTTDSMTSSLRIPLHVRPTPRLTRFVSIEPDVSAPNSPGSSLDRHASPLPTPAKKLMF